MQLPRKWRLTIGSVLFTGAVFLSMLELSREPTWHTFRAGAVNVLAASKPSWLVPGERLALPDSTSALLTIDYPEDGSIFPQEITRPLSSGGTRTPPRRHGASTFPSPMAPSRSTRVLKASRCRLARSIRAASPAPINFPHSLRSRLRRTPGSRAQTCERRLSGVRWAVKPLSQSPASTAPIAP